MTFLRERDIAEMAVLGGIDDLKALLIGEGVDISGVIEVENRVISDIRGIEQRLHELASPEDLKLPRKDFAIKFKDSAGEHFGMLMSMYLGRELDYNDFFLKHILKQQYTLRQLNLIPTVAEVE
jgi:hypothetical protein